MAKIRRGTVTVGGSPIAGVKNVDWNTSYEFDRSCVDDEMAGEPVEMKHGGSGTLTLASGAMEPGYLGDIVISYNEVSVASSVETVTAKTVTFTNVTVNTGGSIDNDAGPGSLSVAFEFGEVS